MSKNEQRIVNYTAVEMPTTASLYCHLLDVQQRIVILESLASSLCHVSTVPLSPVSQHVSPSSHIESDCTVASGAISTRQRS